MANLLDPCALLAFLSKAKGATRGASGPAIVGSCAVPSPRSLAIAPVRPSPHVCARVRLCGIQHPRRAVQWGIFFSTATTMAPSAKKKTQFLKTIGKKTDEKIVFQRKKEIVLRIGNGSYFQG
jgi:hypothetical protein